MTTISPILSRLEQGTLIRNAWTGSDAQGRQTACLLAALAPECGSAKSASVCPATLMPEWLAYLTPWMDDSGTADAWPAMVRRYADLASRWHVLTPAQWDALHLKVRAACLREAMRHTDNARVLAVCEDIAATLESGNWPTETQRSAAWAARAARAAWAAWAAARSAESAAARSAESAAWAAESAEWSAESAESAAESAEWSAESAAWAAESAESAADRLTSIILDLIEATHV